MAVRHWYAHTSSAMLVQFPVVQQVKQPRPFSPPNPLPFQAASTQHVLVFSSPPHPLCQNGIITGTQMALDRVVE
jgi:hypothetical protein